ncbi:FixH family protein [Arhodomonas aquaeolei]|uniref:FixH family protein n=1 Tax=Arhodomonas aquaeolei TaxID=2369 RepID=UPI002167CB0D|nr:FixH family protein [Arhodomonas aquaeolei]MCS4503178.1 FixH family protein [Arhodomonas aquaeolei]
MSTEDQKPWYRQFWCWFVFAPLGVWVIAMIGTVIVLNGNMDDLVVDDYSQLGKTYIQERAAYDRADALGVGARVHVQRDSGRVTLALEGLDKPPENLKVKLVHPTIAKRDLGVEVHRDQTGLYRGGTGSAIDNRRYVIIEPADGSWRLRGELKAQVGDLRLGGSDGDRGA